MRLESAVLGSATILLIAAGPALGQGVPCGERKELVRQLQHRYDETPAAIALTSQGELLEVLTSPDGTWTILVTAPDGPSCLVAVGEGWESRPQLAQEPRA